MFIRHALLTIWATHRYEYIFYLFKSIIKAVCLFLTNGLEEHINVWGDLPVTLRVYMCPQSLYQIQARKQDESAICEFVLQCVGIDTGLLHMYTSLPLSDCNPFYGISFPVFIIF